MVNQRRNCSQLCQSCRNNALFVPKFIPRRWLILTRDTRSATRAATRPRHLGEQMFGLTNSRQSARAMHDGTGAHLRRPGPNHGLAGFPTGMRIATPNGWRVAEAITVGDHVMTFDNGAQMVEAVARGTHFTAVGDLPATEAPIHVPIGAIGNDEPIVVLPEQMVMLESDAAEALFGDPFALVPAKTLEGFRGIDRIVGVRPIEVISLHFENDEIVFAEGGALMLAPSQIPVIGESRRVDTTGGLAAPYTMYREPAARELVEAMAMADARAFAESQGMYAA